MFGDFYLVHSSVCPIWIGQVKHECDPIFVTESICFLPSTVSAYIATKRSDLAKCNGRERRKQSPKLRISSTFYSGKKASIDGPTDFPRTSTPSRLP